MSKSKIEWTDETWNPIAGCSPVSPACAHCYAAPQAARIERMGGAPHYADLTRLANGKPVWTGKIAMAREAKLLEPLRQKKPKRIFVNSMSDLFHEDVPDEWIDRIFAVMALAPQHTFQVLTKRSARMRVYMEKSCGHIADTIIAFRREIAWPRSACVPLPHIPPGRAWWPLSNVWLGVTAEDQRRADERIPDLLATPAAVRFVSCEPMLGAVDLTAINFWSPCNIPEFGGPGDKLLPALRPTLRNGRGPGLDWIICGGESGPDARPMHPDWARGLRDQCAAAGVPFFFKQWGEWLSESDARFIGNRTTHVQGEFVRVGKARAGRLLDGVEHNGFPEAR